MEDFDFDIDKLLETEFASQSLSKNPDDLHLLNLKKKIILTDELLGRFSESLKENENLRTEIEKLKAENIRCMKESQHNRQTLLAHLTTKEDWQNKYDQLETRWHTLQQELDLQTNIVAARDSVARQYVSLIKQKDEELKKLKDEIHCLKNNKTYVETEKKRKRNKYDAAVRRVKKLSEIVEKTRMCSSCQKLKSSPIVKQTLKIKNDLDLGSYSPDSSIPASVCSIDTGFESSVSDSDLEEVSQPKIQKRVLEKTNSCLSVNNKDVCSGKEEVEEKLLEIPSSFTVHNDGIEIHVAVCEDPVISETSCLQCKHFSSTSSTKSVKERKDTAEKYVQTRVVKYVDACTEVHCEVVSKSTQATEEEQASHKVCCKVLSKSVQTIPVIFDQKPSALQTKFSNTQASQTNSNDTQVLQCNIGCQTEVEDLQLFNIDVGHPTSVEDGFCESINCDVLPDTRDSSSPILDEFHSNNSSVNAFVQKQNESKDSDGQRNSIDCEVDYAQLFLPVPCLLSPLPLSPMAEDSVSETDEEIISDTTLMLPNEENTFMGEMLDHPSLDSSVSFTDRTTQTDDDYFVCHHPKHVSCKDASVQCRTTQTDDDHFGYRHPKHVSHKDASVQCEGSEAGCPSTKAENRVTKISVNKYAKKYREKVLSTTREECAAVSRTEYDSNAFWKKLVLCLICNDKLSVTQKESILDLSQDRFNPLHNETLFNSEFDVHSYFKQIEQRQLLSRVEHSELHNKWNVLESQPVDNVPVKPIVVEMSSSPEAVQNKVFWSCCKHHDSYGGDCGEEVVRKKPKRSVNFRQRLVGSKSKNCQKIVDCNRPKGSLRSFALKRKLTSNGRLQITDTTSGSFTVSSNAECCNVRKLNEKLMSHMLPDKNDQDSCDIESGQLMLWDKLHNGTDHTRSTQTFQGTLVMRDNDVNSTVSPDSSSAQHNVPLSRLQREVAITQGLSSDDLRSSCERIAPPVFNVKNGISVETSQNFCKELARSDHNTPPLNTVNSCDGPEISEHLHVPKIVSSQMNEAASRNCDKFTTSQNDQPSTVEQNKGQSLISDSLECLNTRVLSPSSRTSFHSCDTFIVSHVENINKNLKSRSFSPVSPEMLPNGSDADKNNVPRNVVQYKLQLCDNQPCKAGIIKANSSANVSCIQTVGISGASEINAISQEKSEDTMLSKRSDQMLSFLSASETQIDSTGNNNSSGNDTNLLQQIGKTQSSSSVPFEKKECLTNQNCTVDETSESEDENVSESTENDSESSDETTEEANSQLSSLSQEQPRDTPCVLERDLSSDDSSSEDTVIFDDNGNDHHNNYHTRDETMNDETFQELSLEKCVRVSENNCVRTVTNNLQSNIILEDSHEDHMLSSFSHLQKNDSANLNNNEENSTDRTCMNSIELAKKTGVVSEVQSINNFSSKHTILDSARNIISGSKPHKSVKECSELQNHSTEEIKPSFPKAVNISSNKTLPYRKYCESTIKELIAVKPPPVENKIAQKTMIRDAVRVKGLLIPEKARKCVSSQELGKERSVQKQCSLENSTESPFCRQGMSGRKKTVISSLSINGLSCEANKGDKSTENNMYIESTRKQQRIAHAPKSIAIGNKRNVEESSCDEVSSSLESSENKLSKTCRPAVQRPPVKKSKIQRLKHQYITQRKHLQSLNLDNSALKPSTQKVKSSIQDKSKEAVNICASEHLPTFEDIALDMALSDSDESVSEKSDKDKLCNDMWTETAKKFSSDQGLNVEENNSNKINMKLEQHGSHTPGNCRKLTSGAEHFAPNVKTTEKLQENLLTKPLTVNDSGSRICHDTMAHIDGETVERNSSDTVNEEKKPGNKVVVCSSSRNSQNVSELGDVHSYDSLDQYHSANSDIRKCPEEATREENGDAERRDTENDVDSSLLESPLSPPNSQSCETDIFQSPITIPVSPVHVRLSQNKDSVFTPRKYAMDPHSSVLSSEELEHDVEMEDNFLQKYIKSSNSENNGKSKLCSWNRGFNTRMKKCQNNILQEYFVHYYKGQEQKRKKAKPLNYADKKKIIDAVFKRFLDGEFTETALSKVLHDCNKVVEGDYKIIVKNVVKYCKRLSSGEESDYTNNFPLTPTQQRLFTLVIKMEDDHPTIVDEVLERIGLVVCNIRHRRFMPTLYCLARFFTAFCKLRNYKHRAQIFCYDALFCLKVRAHTVIFAVLTAYPECFPNGNSVAGGSPIIRAMVHSIFTYGDASYTATKNLRTYLSNYYCYKRENFRAEEVLKRFTQEIKCGLLPEVEQAILLMAKFKSDWAWTHEKLIKGCLLQTVDNWRKGSVSEEIAAGCLKLCAYLAKIPPYEKIDVSTIMTLFEDLLFSSNPPVVKEACIFSLATLVQMNVSKVFLVLKACKSEKHLQNSKYLKDVLSAVMKRRTMKWWSKFLNE